jgi:Uma2 family endonuclease
MSSLPVTKGPPLAPSSAEVKPVPCVIVDAGKEIVIPPSAHTLAGFRAWAKSDDFPERGRISFIDQEIIVDMSPEEIQSHVKVKWEICRVLGNLNKKTKRGELYGDGALVTNETANLSTVPDATFVSWESLDTGKVRLVPREGVEGEYLEVEGTPDWVLEVISKTSVRKDTKLLRKRYHRAGIPEYWLINARGDDIDFQILLRHESDYESTAGRGGWQESRVFGKRFRLVREKGQRSLWVYTLQAKALR